jgi:Ca2+-binding EF-hand superfamily protein
MYKSLFHTLLAIAISGLSASAIAGYGHGQDKFIQFFDDNQDGTVTIDEFNESAKARFKRMDMDGNGQVTDQEFEQYVQSRRADHRQRYVSRIDRNGDGKVSKEEFIAHNTQMAERKFSYMDKDSDGLVSSDEFDTARMKKYGRRPGGKRIFEHIDGDGNGTLTQQESFTAWSNWFQRIDTNGDKVVSSDEVQAYRESKWRNR